MVKFVQILIHCGPRKRTGGNSDWFVVESSVEESPRYSFAEPFFDTLISGQNVKINW